MLPIDGGGIIGPQQAGQWTLRGVGVQLATGTARCTGVVMVESSLVLDVAHRRTSPTSPLSLTLSVTDAGVAIPSAMATVNITQIGAKAPPRFLTLSKLKTAIGRADGPPNLVDGVIASLTKTVKKSRTQVLPISNGTAAVTIPLGPPARYQVEIEVTGQACGGVFQRYYQFTESVPPPVGSGTTVTVTPGGSSGAVVVTVVPKTTQREALGFGHSAGIVPTVSGGTTSPVVDRLDGSYIFNVQWIAKSRAKPSLLLHVYGKAVRVPKLKKATSRPKKTSRRRKQS
jgi:hypothetical protein